MNNIIPTGFSQLDPMLGGGLHPSSLVVIGGRPGMGKTALMISMMANFLEKDINFSFISMSEKIDQILKKLCACLSQNNYSDFSFPLDGEGLKNLTGIQAQSLVASSVKTMNSKSLFADDVFCVEELFLRLELIVKSNINIIFIDYLQLLVRVGMGDVYEETSKIINELKIFANKNNVTIILASQLSRKVEERPGHRPMMSDFRDTGAIEEAADQILLLLRREYYDPNDKPGIAELLLQKNRFGDFGIIPLAFDRGQIKFYDYYDKRYVYEKQNTQIQEDFDHFSPN